MLEKRSTINDLDPLPLPLVGDEQMAAQRPDGLTGRAPVSDVLRAARDYVDVSLANVLRDVSGALVSSGAGNAFAVASARAPASLIDGFAIAFRADRANTGSATLKIVSVGVDKPLQKEGGAALAQNDVASGGIYEATYIAAIDAFRLRTVSTDAAVSRLVGGAPAALDTLYEIATAINNDDHVFNTLIAQLALKAPLISPAFTGTPTVPTPALGDNSQKIPSTAFVQAAVSGAVGIFGQGILVKSGANIVLKPHRGNLLTVGGVAATIPDLGVSIGPSGSTGTYYVYATQSGGIVNALELSATVRATSTAVGNKGNEIKAGDETRTCVGMVRIAPGTVFVDTPSQRFVRSWLNKAPVICQGAYINGSTNSTSWTGVGNDNAEFLAWGGERAFFVSTGDGYGDTTSVAYFGLAFDGVTPAGGAVMRLQVPQYTGLNVAGSVEASEGHHYARNVYKTYDGSVTIYAVSTQVIGIVG